MKNAHEKVEKNVGLFFLFTVFAISIGGLVEITPLFFQKELAQPVDNLKPYTALQMEGRDVYIREGCHVCHSQMIRPFRAETERYGHYSVAGEHVWEHPFLWGSKRTGPDLARVGGRYSDDWHLAHLLDPRSVVPESNMPAFKWLAENTLDGELTRKKLETFNWLTRNRSHKDEDGNRIKLYSDETLAAAKDAVKGKTEMDALIAYLQSLGHALK
ncbi:MAG: cytochrome-c oxidase, cbb3-type subunit II [Colwellia sp.]|uniref:cytochrome-c oxidase, cbb3-type subunit II n=1 Tax=Colwellia sp. TaxID=56799 RepID=UPI001DEAD31B|nr:cytochrome-c oxidase, cbb3-type subunit II [Colwellia sp.]MCJ8296074.1 cytochrome-c oxidase, cbb3-type subunit II [Colwellia sp.]NQY48829.1 cytochrome-c oxidase, cbb3-type subunit II [Colwellia sp.]